MVPASEPEMLSCWCDFLGSASFAFFAVEVKGGEVWIAIIRSEVYGYLVPARRNLELLLWESSLHPHSKRQCFGSDTMHVGGQTLYTTWVAVEAFWRAWCGRVGVFTPPVPWSPSCDYLGYENVVVPSGNPRSWSQYSSVSLHTSVRPLDDWSQDGGLCSRGFVSVSVLGGNAIAGNVLSSPRWSTVAG